MAKRREYAHERRARLAREAEASAAFVLPVDDDAFVDLVYEAAARIQAPGRFGRFKIFASAIADELHVPLEQVKARLLAAHLARRLLLARADLTSAMGKELVARSEIEHGRAQFHFLDVEPPLLPRRKNPTKKRLEAVRVGKYRSTTILREE
jgi:hypothetical protein